MKTVYAFALIMLALCSCDKGPTRIKSSGTITNMDNGDTISIDEIYAAECIHIDTVVVYKTIELYEGYIHPSGDYKWTTKGWLALRPFFRLSEDSTRLIQIK